MSQAKPGAPPRPSTSDSGANALPETPNEQPLNSLQQALLTCVATAASVAGPVGHERLLTILHLVTYITECNTLVHRVHGIYAGDLQAPRLLTSAAAQTGAQREPERKEAALS